MLKRVSIVISLICVGILLLSACGWGPPPPTWVALPNQTFILWQTTAGVPQTILGVGEISGFNQNFSLNGVLVPSRCSPSWQFSLMGSYLPGIPPRDAVVQSSAQGKRLPPGFAVDLTGSIRGNNSNRSVLPLVGSMKIQNWCNGQLLANVEARPGPDFKHTWRLTERTNGGFRITLTLKQTIADGNGVSWIWGDFYFYKNLGKSTGCWASGAFTPHPSAAPPADVTLGNSRGPSATLTVLPTTLNPDPPAEFQTTISIHGGPCDGQSFPVTLKSH